MQDDFLLTNLELRESTETGEEAEGLSHRSMKGMFLLQVLELAAHGEPRGAATVVHGAGDHGGRYRDFAGELAKHGLAVALPDMRGHGGSEGERGHSAGLKEVVRDLTEVQNHLAYRLPDAPKVLVGQGLGALYCAVYALESPGSVSGLVLLSPLHDPQFDLPQPAGGLKKFFKKVGPTSPGGTGYTGAVLTSDAEQASAWDSDALSHDTITLRAGNQAEEAAGYLARLAELGVPVLVLHGSDDPLSPSAKSEALAGGQVTAEVRPGERHDLLHDTGRAEVAARVVAWIATVVD